jgi:hypothetical protein
MGRSQLQPLSNLLVWSDRANLRMSGFLLPKLRKQRHRPTKSQISLKTEGDFFVAGSDSAQQLLALCHAAVAIHGSLEGRLRELIACATGHPEKKPPVCAGGFCLVQERFAAYRLAWRLAPPLAPAAWLPGTSPLETSLTQSEPSAL